MTKEQEAIEIAKKFTKMDFSNPMGWTGYYDTELKELSQAIETVLNMLKEKDRQINSKNGTINALQCALKERIEERDRKDDIVTKQNKIIDLMAERIEWLCKNFGILLDEEHDENFTQEDIKQYFERKVKK